MKTSNGLNLVTKCWLKCLDLLPLCTGAAAACSNGLSQGKSSHSEIPPTSRSEPSLKRLRLDEEAHK